MSELLLAYAVFTLAVASGDALPVRWFHMPMQENYFLWKTVGWGGLLTFQARWVVQWIHSERRRESSVPIAFWWLSLIGALLELAYFLRQQDSVGIGGYCISAVPYTRNLMLIYAKRARDAGKLSAGVVYREQHG